jgi:hypothetical protein
MPTRELTETESNNVDELTRNKLDLRKRYRKVSSGKKEIQESFFWQERVVVAALPMQAVGFTSSTLGFILPDLLQPLERAYSIPSTDN